MVGLIETFPYPMAELPIIQKTYDLIKWYVPILNSLARSASRPGSAWMRPPRLRLNPKTQPKIVTGNNPSSPI